ncbi:hypothetical protein NEHOM01_0656 [Nematocida homosporus]|uniref:uncharacterized protein n=1 Tax=Nematocida homosporus TaxID=1912981 RepID=UPI00221FD78E|nr:uncharacterized protein NEHOM01_0656 [Nematocida homosporus]KAI5185151.1 hypothetical protein NEHOM01_0656 [Nematocida homosporus]
MRPSVDVFLLYVVYVLCFSLLNSSEERVILGGPPLVLLRSLEMQVIDRVGCLIPYVLVYMEVVRKGSWLAVLGVISEVVVYVVVKDTVIVYVKEMHVFLSGGSLLPLNPSGHTFMFLNGVYVLIPVAYSNRWSRRWVCLVSGLIIAEYSRLMMETATYYHTFSDVGFGVLFFFLFRGLVSPVRRVYRTATYCNEWSEKGYFVASLGLGVVLAVWQFL